MFGHPHYVPVLRWKQGERLALQAVQPEDREIMTPLVELVPRDFGPDKNGRPRAPADVVERKAEELLACWGKEPLFLDLRLLPSRIRGTNSGSLLERLCELGRNLGLSIVPVTGMGSPNSYQSAVASIARSEKRGACIRLTAKDIRSSAFRSTLSGLLSYLGLRYSQVDLFIDCQFVKETPIDIESVSTRLPHLTRWRTFTVGCGAFPRDLRGFSVGEHVLPRLDWLSWQTFMLNSTKLTRRPSYSDFTIQHPVFYGPPRHPRYSASIRYTAEEHWVIMRGESVFKDDGPGMKQWPANAQMLCERAEFRGPDFSEGDRYIKEMSLQTEKTGTARTWLQAGINHHLTYQARQIHSFFGAPVGDAP